jgi:hypothetical protein
MERSETQMRFTKGIFRFMPEGLPIAVLTKDGPGEINIPVSIGGMIVNSVDLTVGDEDGLVSIPPDVAESLLAKIHETQLFEYEINRTLEQGGSVDRSWVNKCLSREDANGRKRSKPSLMMPQAAVFPIDCRNEAIPVKSRFSINGKIGF